MPLLDGGGVGHMLETAADAGVVDQHVEFVDRFHGAGDLVVVGQFDGESARAVEFDGEVVEFGRGGVHPTTGRGWARAVGRSGREAATGPPGDQSGGHSAHLLGDPDAEIVMLTTLRWPSSDDPDAEIVTLPPSAGRVVTTRMPKSSRLAPSADRVATTRMPKSSRPPPSAGRVATTERSEDDAYRGHLDEHTTAPRAESSAWPGTDSPPTQLSARAAYLLRGNDLGTMTSAAPKLYPHMWSWDAAFVTVGLAPLSVERAVIEMDTLLSAQWRNGMIPHIVFANGRDGYFPPGPAAGSARDWPSAPPDFPRHLGDHPASGPRDRGAAHPRPFPTPRPDDAGGGQRVHRPPVEFPGAMAPVAGSCAGSHGARPDHHLPRLGIRYGQLAALGLGIRECRSGTGPAAVLSGRSRPRVGSVDAADRPRVRPLPLAGRTDEARELRRRRVAEGHEFRGRGRLRQCDLRRGLRCARDDR